jgi:hypothetical protein
MATDRYTNDSGGKPLHLHWYVIPGLGQHMGLNITRREPVLVSWVIAL